MNKKHREAMEDFIRTRMQETLGDKANLPNNPSSQESSKDLVQNVSSSSISALEEELYKKLAKSISSNKNSSTNSNKNEEEAMLEKQREGDVGAGGAMLGGTGLAEVLLPVENRLRNVRETEKIAMMRMRERNGDYTTNDIQTMDSPGTKDDVLENQQDLSALL